MSLDAIAWLLMAAGVTLIVLVPLAPAIDRGRRCVRAYARRRSAELTSLTVQLYLWLLAVAVWMTLLALMVLPTPSAR